MHVNIQKFYAECGISEQFYPGKRMIFKLPHAGEHKSHCMVSDWRQPNLIRIDIKAGLSGKTLPAKELKKCPISFQSPTYMEISVRDENYDPDIYDSTEEEEGDSERGKGGSGKQPKKRIDAFSKVMKGRIPETGEIKKLVVMGKEIAKNAMESVLNALVAQIKNMAIVPVNLLASATKVTRVAPGGRPAHEIDPSLLRGTQRYNPQDMFGVPAPKS